jgi:hypothetical protein
VFVERELVGARERRQAERIIRAGMPLDPEDEPMTSGSTLNAPTASPTGLRIAWNRALGALIMLKVALPALMLLVLGLGVWQIVSGVYAAVDHARAAIEPRIAEAQQRIDEIQAEGRRLIAEVKKIENTTSEIAGAVKQSVEPIRKSLLGLSGAMRTLSRTIEAILNAIIGVVNNVPLVRDIPRVSLPDLNLPGLQLPNLDIDVNFKPDLAAVHALNALAQGIAAQAQTGIDEVARVVRFWWWTIKVVAAMIAAWLALTLIGYAARAAQRFATGWRMLCGQPAAGGLALL